LLECEEKDEKTFVAPRFMEYLVILVVAATTGVLALGMACSGLAAVIYVTERAVVRASGAVVRASGGSACRTE
jgi:hypothetical protein